MERNAVFQHVHDRIGCKARETGALTGFEAVGKAIVDGGWLEDVAAGYAAADGFGHHFAHYDGESDMIHEWHVFRVN